MFTRDSQPPKAESPIVVTLFGIFMFTRESQLLKANFPIVVTLFGIFMLVSESQPQKAESPIVVTLFGMFMFTRNSQPQKACSPIVVTLFGIFMLVRESQDTKAEYPIVVTLLGIFMLVRDLQPPKATSPITFTPFLIEYLPLKLSGASSNLFQSLLYFTPNSSCTALLRSSSVTFVLHTSSSFGFCTPNNLKEHMDKSFLALANRNIARRVLVSSSANKPCRAVKVSLLLKSR